MSKIPMIATAVYRPLLCCLITGDQNLLRLYQNMADPLIRETERDEVCTFMVSIRLLPTVSNRPEGTRLLHHRPYA